MGKVTELVNILRRAVKLAMVISGDNRTAGVDNRTIRIASPRLLSLVPEEVRSEVRGKLQMSINIMRTKHIWQ